MWNCFRRLQKSLVSSGLWREWVPLSSPASDSARFHEILKALTERDEGKLHILKVVYEVWRNHPQVRRHRCGCANTLKCGHLGSNVARLSAASQMIAVLVDKMIRTQIVDCAAVANWLFSQDMAHEFTRWDLKRAGRAEGGGSLRQVC